MEIPSYQPFYLHSLDELRAEIARLGLEIPVEDDVAALAQPATIGRWTIANRLCAQPIAGNDAEPGGAPSELTRRRYQRYAAGGFGLIWVERTVAGSGGRPRQLCLNAETLPAFREMIARVRASGAERATIVLQLAGERAELTRAAMLAVEAGFDGVDLQCGREDLAGALRSVRECAPSLLLATRLCVYDATRGGFGVAAEDYRRFDLEEPIRMVRQWVESGLALLNVTAASPCLMGADRGTRGIRDSENPDEHPLMTLERQLTLAGEVRKAVPGLRVIGSGFSWLRQFIPEVVAGALHARAIDFAGLGRAALADPAIPAGIFAQGRVDAGQACMLCSACSKLSEEGAAVGCVLRDAATYGRVYREARRFDPDRLLAAAARCHLCEAAPCVAASPTRTDIPGFIDAFRKGDEQRACEIIRASDPLPELTARISPAWLECEGACIETTLAGTPVPIFDLQLAIAWRARERGVTGVRMTQMATGKRIAIVGGGPAGIAAAVRLVEHGHAVELYEQAQHLGGVATRVLASHRKIDPRDEIEALLRPAIAAGRLRLHFGRTLGEDVLLDALCAEHDAVLIATGLWQERSLGSAPGVIGGLAFLESPHFVVPERVAILAGGDSAMDAARAALSRGAKEIFVVFGGPRSAMHWHLPESWFATPGVQAMMQWQPLGYERDLAGKVCGVRLRHAELHREATLSVGMVVEAMGLEPSDAIRPIVAGKPARVHTAGALVNGGASVGRCIADGLGAAAAIHRELTA